MAAVVAHVATAALLVALARRRWGDRWGAAAGFGYLLLSVGLAPEDTQAATFEVFALPWTVAAVLCADRRRWGAAGVAVAGAALTKQTGAVVLLPVVWMLWRAGRESRAAPAGAWVRLAAGCALPVAAVALATGAGRFVFWTVTGSGTYMSPEGAWLLAAGRGSATPRSSRRPERGSYCRPSGSPRAGGPAPRPSCGSGSARPPSPSWRASSSTATTTCNCCPRSRSSGWPRCAGCPPTGPP